MQPEIKTEISTLFNIRYPIIGAPMFLISNPALVAAISNAGGLGTFAAMSYRTISEMQKAIHEIRELTDKPFGINLVLHKEHNPMVREQFQVCLAEKIPLIITSMGTPRTSIKEAHEKGLKVFCDVTNIKQAAVVAKCGADGIIAVSQGAGGHAGPISPFALVLQIKEETNVPVIAAGAISRGQHMSAAFCLGASAVSVGTRFIAAIESPAPEGYKKALIEANSEDIIYSDLISGVHANWLRTSFEKWQKFQSDKNHDTGLKKWIDIWSAGHGVAQIHEVLSVSDIIENMVAEYHHLKKLLP